MKDLIALSMSVDKSVLLQKQVKDNSEDLQTEFLDLKNWEKEMKRKDQELLNQNNDQVLPPIRSKKKKIVQKPATKEEKCNTNTKRIKSSDYSAWDKFDVEKACKEIDKTDSSEESEEELNEDALTTKHDLATEHKQKGNIFVQQKKWDNAIACYSEAIKIFPYDAVFYANRALCHLKKDNLYSAEADCSTAIQLDSTYVKAYHRRAITRLELKQYKEAKEDLEKILKLEPSNKEAQVKLTQVNKKLEAKPVIIFEEKALKETSVVKNIGEKMWNSNNKINKEINNKKIEQDVVNKTIKSKTKYMQIPKWLPEKDNVEIVEPIVKPPHLHTKRSMKRIVVQDAEFGIATCKNEAILINSTDNVQQTESSNMVDDKIVIENNTLIKPLEVEKNVPVDLPKVPKTAVQFLIDWRRNKSSEYRYHYLKQLPSNSLPRIFQDSMESDIFSEVLDILRIEFIPRKDSIHQYLKDLSQVKRFRALIMFINNAEKDGIKILLEYCKNTENKSEEKIEELYKAYEI
ncbi:RNA polymerase II-associated protein 3 isoform X1 [Vespa velutina]|uniref:RNA polymerase II-associated protein 3 isoform X1 n=2 Tax=Vespa velutina TaxID=202808 RepID=UPI001FB41CB0|nr:RNA polymerase II-associated protein 3 isoform X1 [Vespa velutina]